MFTTSVNLLVQQTIVQLLINIVLYVQETQHNNEADAFPANVCKERSS